EGFWEDGRYKEAIEEYEALVTVHPQSEFSPKAIYKIGIIRMLYLSDYDKALETFKRLSSLFPESMEARLSRRHAADIYMNNIEDYKRAVFEYQQLIDDGVIDDPDMAQFNIAVAYLKLGDLAQARIEFRDLIERYPASPLTAQAYYQVANSFLLEGEGEEAIKEYEKVIEVYPDSPFYIESQFGIAMLLEEMGKLKEALSLYNTIEKEYPNPFALRVRIEGLENRLKQ
ncbi:MAG: tol-pal system YbgF family protein, partial [Thermodesulfobacteriota bacterium]